MQRAIDLTFFSQVSSLRIQEEQFTAFFNQVQALYFGG